MKYITPFLFFLFVFFSNPNPSFGQKTKLSYYDSTGVMPAFRYYYPNGNVFTPDSLSKEHTTVFIYFKADCPYCAKEADIVANNINELPTIDFIFISRQDTAFTYDFARLHKLNTLGRVKFLQDKEKMYHKIYYSEYNPSVHIYDKNKKLLLFNEGVLSKEEFLKYMK